MKIGTTGKGIGTTYAGKALRMNLRMGDLLDENSFNEKYNNFYNFVEKIFNIPPTPNNEKDQLIEFGRFAKDNNMIIDSTQFIAEKIKAGKKILAEGANGALLDIDHGTFPFVTSSNTTTGGICTGLGVPPQSIETIIGTVKAYTTRVGAGPLPSAMPQELDELVRQKGGEFGVL